MGDRGQLNAVIVPEYYKIILGISVSVLILGVVVLLGWVFDVPVFKSIYPGYVNMKFNTAVGLVLIAGALLLQLNQDYKIRIRLSQLMAAAVLLLGFVTSIEIITGADFGIDHFFLKDEGVYTAHDVPGRMSFITAICFTFTGIAVLTLGYTNRVWRLFIQGLLHVVTLLSYLAIVGYLFNVPAFYRLAVFSTMAVHTAVAFFFFSIALTLVCPRVGITGLFTGNSIGSVMVRRVFVQTLVAVLVLAYLRILTHRYELVNEDFGIALFATSFILTTFFVLWRNSIQLNLIDSQRNEIANSLQRFKVFLDSSPDPMIIVDTKGMIRLVSKQTETVFGYTKEELLGRHVEELLPERYRSRQPGQRNAFLAQLSKSEMAAGVDMFALRKDGSEFQVEISLSPIESMDGIYTSAAIRDVTSRKKIEQQLKETTDRLVMATNASFIGVWDYDVVNNKLMWDDCMYLLYGIDKRSFEGVYQAWQKSVHPDDLEAASREVELALAGTKDFDTEFRVVWPDGSVHFIKSKATVYRNADGAPIRMLGTNLDITDRKRFEIELNRINERNRIFVEQAPNAIAMFDTEMRYLAASHKWITDYHLEGVEIIGRSHYDVFPEIGDDWKAIHQECLKGAVNRTDASPFERADGSIQWLTWDVRPWYVTEGQIGGLLMYTADITEVKRTDTEKLRIEKILSRTNQIARIATWEVDGLTGNATWSDIAYKIWELPEGHGVPQREQLLNMYTAKSRSKILEAINKQVQDGSSYDLELEFVSAEGNNKWIRLIADADFENGVCKRRFGVFQDITDAKLAQEAITRANEELEAIFHSGYVSIISTDTAGLITNFNKGAEILLQYSAAEMVGKQTPYIIHAPEEVDARSAELTKMYGKPIQGFDVFVELARLGRYESREWTYVRKDGTRFPVQLIVSSIRNSAGEITGFIGVATDITERKKAEEKLRNYSILESKSKEMEQFAYIASHDLREPLLTIKSFAGLLDEEYGSTFNEDGRIYINAIIKSIGRMEALTKGLLDYSRLGQIKPLENVDCNAVMNDVVADLNSLISSTGATVVVGDLPRVNGHALELKLLFQNLLNNAIKFRKKEVPPIVHINAVQDKNGFRFSVEDNGIGINEKSRDKIFVMFQRLHNRDAYEGTGIGLAQCKKIVEMHNGKIWVESEPGKYSRFNFTITT